MGKIRKVAAAALMAVFAGLAGAVAEHPDIVRDPKALAGLAVSAVAGVVLSVTKPVKRSRHDEP